MKKSKITLIIIGPILLIIIIYNLYSINSNQNSSSNKNFTTKNFDNNESYNILVQSLFIDYSKFIKDSDKYIKEILKEFESIEPQQIYIENIDGDNFDFLYELTSKINFKIYGFDFYKYNDNYNYIFDSINKNNKIDEIKINFYSKLDGKQELTKTFNKIKSIIDNSIESNNKLDNKNNKIEAFIINGYDSFNSNYSLSKKELDIISKFKINFFVNKVNFKSNFSEEYIINYLKNTEINNFYNFLDYRKINGKITKINENKNLN